MSKSLPTQTNWIYYLDINRVRANRRPQPTILDAGLFLDDAPFVGERELGQGEFHCSASLECPRFQIFIDEENQIEQLPLSESFTERFFGLLRSALLDEYVGSLVREELELAGAPLRAKV